MRLRKLKEQFNDGVRIESRSFPLRPVPDPTATFQGTYREAAWQRVAAMSAEDGIRFTVWARDDYPTWSLPALEAAKCVALQGYEAFERIHLLLFEAFFTKGINIGNRDEVTHLVRCAEVDIDRFLRDYESGTARAQVLREYDEARTVHRVSAIPTVIFDSGRALVGAASFDAYVGVLRDLGVR